MLDELHRLGVHDSVLRLYSMHGIPVLNYMQAHQCGLIKAVEFNALTEGSRGAYFSWRDAVALNMCKIHSAHDAEATLLHEFAHATGHSRRDRRPRMVFTEEIGPLSWAEQAKHFTKQVYIEMCVEEIVAEGAAISLVRRNT